MLTVFVDATVNVTFLITAPPTWLLVTTLNVAIGRVDEPFPVTYWAVNDEPGTNVTPPVTL